MSSALFTQLINIIQAQDIVIIVYVGNKELTIEQEKAKKNTTEDRPTWREQSNSKIFRISSFIHQSEISKIGNNK